MIKVVIFDLDDTLISEFEYICSGYSHIAGILSARLSLASDSIYSDLMNLFLQDSKCVFDRFFLAHKIKYSNEDIMELVDEYRSHQPIIHFYNDVLPCIDAIKSMGIKVAIITDGYEKAQRQKVKSLEAERYFDEIILTDELGREFWKPSPKAFEIISEKFDVSYEKMIYVGDNPEKDFFISSIHPIKTVRLLRNGVHSNKKYLAGIKESFSILNLDQLVEIIKQYS